MRRLIPFVAVGVLALTLAAPVAAAKPIGGCPNESFDEMSKTEFRNLSRSLGVPEEFLGAVLDEAWTAIDKNEGGTGTLCVKDLPDTPGHLGAFIFNVVDNTSKH